MAFDPRKSFRSAFAGIFLLAIQNSAAIAMDREFALPIDQTCPIELPPLQSGAWTPAEKWAWRRLCLGKEVDMRGADFFATDDEPCQSWKIGGKTPKHRVLRPTFLISLLTRERWARALPRPELYIKCAIIDEEMNIEEISILLSVYLEGVYFKKNIRLLGAEFHKTFSVEKSKFEKLLDLEGVTIKGDLFLRDGSIFKEGVNLLGAKCLSEKLLHHLNRM